MRLHIGSEDYNIYIANNVSMVQKMHDAHQKTWFGISLPWKVKTIKFSPFGRTCAGILTKENYSISLQIFQINYCQVLMTLAGLALFRYAPAICRNEVFHYSTGIMAGVFLFLVLVPYLIERKFKLGQLALPTYLLSAYFSTLLWYNVKIYLAENHMYVLGYLVISGAIGFAACYRMGPVTDTRSINLIQWTLQFLALVLIYLSSYHQWASGTIALGILLWASVSGILKNNIPVHGLKFAEYFGYFKPTRRLLSEDEYMEQSRVETEKALSNLREYCQSPKCSPWKLTASLESPTRFAEFVQGSFHINEKEVMEYSQIDFSDEDLLPESELGRNDNRCNYSSVTDDDSSGFMCHSIK